MEGVRYLPQVKAIAHLFGIKTFAGAAHLIPRP